MLEKLPGVASADADKATRSVTVVYDKTVYDVNSIGDQGRYKFELKQDSAQTADDDMDAKKDDGEMSGSDDKDSSAMESKDETEDQASQSMIKIEDAPQTGGSDAKEKKVMAPSLNGPAS